MWLNNFPENLNEYFDVVFRTWKEESATAFPVAEPKIFRPGLSLFTTLHPDAAVKRVRKSYWQDLRSLYLGQARRSNAAIKGKDVQSHFSFSISEAKFTRKFGQLPCTIKSIDKRVEAIKNRISKDHPLLIIGDDDALSIALAKEGFTDLTVLDIDENVVNEISEAFKTMPEVKVDIRRHDVFEPLPVDLIRDYALVTFDPWYALDGLDAFIATAVHSSHLNHPQILLSFNCGALLQDFVSFVPTINSFAYKVKFWSPLANVYPVPRTLSLPIGLAESLWSLIFNFKKADSAMAKGPQLFSSDMLWLEPIYNDAPTT
jgi:hypothetical protein